MDFYQVIQSRESIRNYNPDKKVSADILEKILNAGRIAPSAVNFQPWRFVVVQSKEKLKQVKAAYNKPWFADAPCVLIVKGKRKKAWTRQSDGYNSLETDLAIAMDHMILTAENENVGTCWIAAFKPDILKKTLQLTDDEDVFAMTPLGYQKDGFEKRGKIARKPLEEVVTYL